MSPAVAPARIQDRTLSRTRSLALVAVMAALIAASSWISIPFYPVPLTLQTLAVLIAGGVLGVRKGVLAVLVFLGVGVLGLPVFHSGSGGFGVIFGPTGGYLVGFLLAALVMGMGTAAAKRAGLAGRRGFVILLAAAAAASIVVYVPGIPWLMVATSLSLKKAVLVGFVPFVLGDAAKTLVAAGVTRSFAAKVGGEY